MGVKGVHSHDHSHGDTDTPENHSCQHHGDSTSRSSRGRWNK